MYSTNEMSPKYFERSCPISIFIGWSKDAKNTQLNYFLVLGTYYQRNWGKARSRNWEHQYWRAPGNRSLYSQWKSRFKVEDSPGRDYYINSQYIYIYIFFPPWDCDGEKKDRALSTWDRLAERRRGKEGMWQKGSGWAAAVVPGRYEHSCVNCHPSGRDTGTGVSLFLLHWGQAL